MVISADCTPAFGMPGGRNNPPAPNFSCSLSRTSPVNRSAAVWLSPICRIT